MNGRAVGGIVIIAAVLAAAVVARLALGRSIDGALVIGWPEAPIREFRLGAVAGAATVGAALGLCGAVLQALLRNPLASPFVLGVSGGAGTGVAVAALGASWAGAAVPTGGALEVPAALGAVVALAAVLSISRRQGAVDPVTLVLSGVIVGTVCAAASTVIESLLPPDRRGSLVAWAFGRIPEVPDPAVLWTCVSATAAFLALTAWLGPRLDAATLSDDEARSVGVPLGALRAAMFLGCGIVTATTVVLCGPIAFVGLLAPLAARAAVGARNRPLAFASALGGAALLVGADALRQCVDLGGGRLPLGAVTAALGGVAFLVLVRRTAGEWRR
ncbi:MAG: FecCD family ABC transporter permease [Phycisphaerales bacterium]